MNTTKPALAHQRSPVSTRDDLRLAISCASGDEGAQRELARRLHKRVLRTTGYLAGSNHEAEDLAQTALIKILSSVDNYRGECPLEFWADRISIRVAMKHFHKQKRRERIAEAIWDPGSAAPTVDDQVSLLEVRRRIAGKLQELSYDRRIAVVLHHVEGYRISEIASITGAPHNTVRDRLQKGRAQLRKKLMADPLLDEWAKAVLK